MSLYNIGEMRKPYNDQNQTFSEDQLSSREPFEQFSAWFEEARKAEGIFEANSMCLATATKDGVPSARIVLLKGFSKEDGFTFYTKYTSRKGIELMENPIASLCFYWEPLKKSIRIEGDVQKVSEKAASEYFSTRPRKSQVAAFVSCQSPKLIANRTELNEQLKNVEQEFKEGAIPKPQDWGGYTVIPRAFEFWLGQSDRAHDRISFRRKEPNEVLDPKLTSEGDDGWVIERLAP